MKFLRDMGFLLDHYKKYLVYMILAILLFELLRVAENKFLGMVIDTLVETTRVNMLNLTLWISTSLLRWLMDVIVDFYVLKLIIGVDYRIPSQSIRHLMTLSMNFFNSAGTGRLAKRIEKGANSTSELLQALSWEFTSSAIQYLVTTVYLATIDIRWGLVLITTAPMFSVLTLVLNKVKEKMRKERHDLYEESGHLLYQIMSNMPIIKGFAQESYETEKYESLLKRIYDITLREFKFDSFFNILRSTLLTITLALVFWIGTVGVTQGTINVGDVVVAMNLATAATLSMFRLNRIFVRLMDNYEAISRVVEFLHEEPDINDDTNAKELTNVKGSVEFRKVSYAYKRANGKGADCIKQVSFKIPAGKTVGIVGHSGSGKSTLMNLLLRFMDPQEGQILVDGQDIRYFTQKSLRQQMAIVLQDNVLFDRTLGENVTEGHIVKDYRRVEDEVWGALEQAFAHSFVGNMQDGLGTIVGERGVKLSGGQRQRIAIARALITKPKILIMDEATSSVDTESEAMIQRSLARLQEQGTTTIFIIAHRLSTIRNADIILVLDGGKLVQQGNHEELLKDPQGVYAKMVCAQTL